MGRLNKRQREAVFDHPGNTLISASPGSGKTKTLVARALHKMDDIPDFKTLALITYTNAATDEIGDRIGGSYDVFIGTIHRFCLEFILRPFGWIYGWNKPRVVTFDELEEFLDANKESLNFASNAFPIDELNKIKKTLDGNLDRSIVWENTISIEDMADLYYTYLEGIKAIDFNEILFRSYEIINKNPFVAKSLSYKFHEILVDEFQDTSLFQYEIFRLINEAGDCTFFKVGDEKQKIFGFAGAVTDALITAQEDFESDSVELIQTYRSTDNIINAYSKLFENHPKIVNESVFKDLDISIQRVQVQNSVENLATIEAIINHLIHKQGIAQSKIAILSTSFWDAFSVSKHLRKNEELNVVGLGALPHNTKNIKDATFDLLRSLARFRLEKKLKNLRSVKRHIELHNLEHNILFEQQELNRIINLLIIQFEKLDSELSLHEGLNQINQVLDNLFKVSHNTFNNILSGIKEDELPFWSFGRYLDVLAGINGILSQTIHKAKGLEFDVVILNNINEGKLPHQKKWKENGVWKSEPITQEAIENGINVFYVAISRARKILFITHNPYPSRYLAQIFRK